MTGAVGRVCALWRHPIKSHGREAIDQVLLNEGQTMPGDRVWAVTHEDSDYTPGAWGRCQNFMIGTRTPGLAGLWATLSHDGRHVRLVHRDLGELSFAPDEAEGEAQFLQWVAPLVAQGRSRHGRIVRADRGMTDSDFPSISIMNRSSHRAVSQKLGRDLEEERWRGNIWFDGLGPWEEFDWIGKRVQIGEAVLEVRERIERCAHTKANPRTGQRDAETLDALDSGWGHLDFGVYAVVLKGGLVASGDMVEQL